MHEPWGGGLGEGAGIAHPFAVRKQLDARWAEGSETTHVAFNDAGGVQDRRIQGYQPMSQTSVRRSPHELGSHVPIPCLP